jgi:small subunit ribosomal protein S17
MEETRKSPRQMIGEVVSDKMNKTIVVSVETHKRHPKYGKRVKYGKKYYAHDENGVAKEGDLVLIAATRPLSALKRWRLVKVLTKADISVKEALAEEQAVDEEIAHEVNE